MGRADIALPGAAAEVGAAELSLPGVHFQDDVAVGADEAGEADLAGAATGEAITVSNVAVVGKLAGAVAVGAGAELSGGHDLEAVGDRSP